MQTDATHPASVVSDSLSISFPYSAAEHTDALSESSERRRRQSWYRFCGVLIGGLGPLGLVLGAATGAPVIPLLGNTLPLVALGAFWFWGAPAVLRFIETRQLRREGTQEGRDIETRTFSRDGFTPTAQWSRPIPWSSVERVVETKRFLLVYASSDGPFYLPKHVLSHGDRTRLDSLFREAFQTRPKQLLLLPRAT